MSGAISSSSHPIKHLSLFHYYQKRKSARPFLARNVRVVLNALTMGSKLSKMSSPFAGAKHRSPEVSDEDEDEDLQPPTKRRRLNTSHQGPGVTKDELGFRKPFGQVTNETSRQLFRPRPGPVQPSDFYGKTRKTLSGKRPFSDMLQKPTDFRKALRVEISEIGPILNEEDVTLAIKNPSQKIKCNLLVAIFGRKSETEGFVERCRRSKICSIHVTLEDGVMKRAFDEPQSFVFLPHEFYMNRKARTGTDNNNDNVLENEFECTYGFADRYSLQVIIEPVGYHEAWPPVHVPIADNSEEHQPGFAVSKAIEDKEASWIDVSLLAETRYLMTASSQVQTPSLKVCSGSKTQPLDDFLRLKVLWALPSYLSAVTAKEAKFSVETPVKKLQAFPLASPVLTNIEELSMAESPANGRRARKHIEYNLKKLSAQAQGRSPRVYKHRGESNASPSNLGVTVTYTLGSLEAAELNVKRESKVSGLMCPFCGCSNRSVDFLTFHLQNEHITYKFQLRRAEPRVQYFVTAVRSRPSSISNELCRTLQLTKPTTVFELEKFINGDESWIKSRYGPLHHALPEHLRLSHLEGGQGSSLSSSSLGSRYSSPNTSNDTDDMIDLESRLKAFSATLPVRSEKRLYVPYTAKPLYDTITKRVLEPGEELPNSDDEKEESWLILKHRDAINDYTDLTAEEKDYINRWNPFIMEEHMTSAKYLGHALQRFVLTNRMWFAETPGRIREFQKLCQSYKLRGIISLETRRECMKIIQGAGNEAGKTREEQSLREDVEMTGNDINADTKEETPRPRVQGSTCSICLEHVERAGRVICADAGSPASKCPGRFYHRECAKKSGRRPVKGKWLCDHCFSLEAPAS